MSTSQVAVLVLLWMSGCGGAPAPAKPVASEPMVEPAPTVPAEKAGLPVPEAVARLHQSAFERTSAEAKLGKVSCFVTLHDAALARGEFHALVLFATGSVGTWRQTQAGGEEPFFAKLSPEEQTKADALVGQIAVGRALAKEKFDSAAMVMGVSTRTEERIETLYFDGGELPRALSELVGMLKARLEATNR